LVKVNLRKAIERKAIERKAIERKVINMSYLVKIELFDQLEIVRREFESISSRQILESFNQIDWEQQITWGLIEEHQGEFPFFQIEQTHSGRKFGGIFVAYSATEYNFAAHAALYEKRQTSRFWGLFKSEDLPRFNHDNLPFDIFKICLEKFIQGNDTEIERLIGLPYVNYDSFEQGRR